MQPVDAQRFVRDEMSAIFPVSQFPRPHEGRGSARRRAATAHSRRPAAHPRADQWRIGQRRSEDPGTGTRSAHQSRGLRRAGRTDAGRGAGRGRAGGRVRSLLAALLRPGDALRHLQLPRAPVQPAIDSPLVSRPNVLLALNEPSLRKFLPTVEPGGVVLYNGPALPEDCARADVRMMARPFTEIGRQAGELQSRQYRDAGGAAGSHRPAG